MLNQQQKISVASRGNVLITACPGSGKSTVMSHKAAKLLNSETGNLVAVTFTKDAAEELKRRIIKQAGEDKKIRVAAGTFHSLCLSMCKKAGVGFDLISEAQRQFVFKKIASSVTTSYSWKEVQEIVDAARCTMNGYHNDDQKALCEAYSKELAVSKKQDFQDIIIKCVELLSSGFLSPINCKWMLVDEAQDMDEWQLEWILLHARSGIYCTVVGDDDQAIYGFRGSLGYEGMMKFQMETRATVLTLPINYRCHSEILSPAATMIENNLERVNKLIQSGRGEGGAIRVVEYKDREEELSSITKVMKKEGGKSEWGILARNNSLLDSLEVYLMEEGVKYKRVNSSGFWESPIAQLYLNTLKHLIKPNWLSMQHLMHSFKVDMVLIEGSSNFTEVLSKMRKNAKGIESVRELSIAIPKLQSDVNAPAVAMEVAVLISRFYPKNKDGHSVADALPRAAKIIEKFTGTLAQKLSSIERLDDNKDDREATVYLMTLHASKGLEYEKVWMMSCEQDVIPSADSPIDEERRLFYVGMTRAKNLLVLSRAKTIMVKSGDDYVEEELKPSIFLGEIY